jgi:Protein of unknown function (DUF3106)
MKGVTSAGVVSRAAKMPTTVVISLFLCLPSAWARGQHQSAPRAAAAPRYTAPRAPNRQIAKPPPGRAQGNAGYPPYRGAGQQEGYRPPAGMPPAAVRPANPGLSYQGQGYARPAYPGAAGTYAPPGHLGAWLNAHRGVSSQDQERMLHNDPSFNRLPPAQQQRLMQQLNRVDQMPEAQRERRLARAENLERLSPQERAQVQDSFRRWNTLPADRQAVMKSAFQDLRNVPPDQRQTVLNSARYQNAFSPDERGILSNMLTVEPYQPPK